MVYVERAMGGGGGVAPGELETSGAGGHPRCRPTLRTGLNWSAAGHSTRWRDCPVSE
jgi:hypothetical protein